MAGEGGDGGLESGRWSATEAHWFLYARSRAVHQNSCLEWLKQGLSRSQEVLWKFEREKKYFLVI